MSISQQKGLDKSLFDTYKKVEYYGIIISNAIITRNYNLPSIEETEINLLHLGVSLSIMNFDEGLINKLFQESQTR